jgi:hypothetical protein
VFIGRACLLTLEGREFGARLLGVVLVRNDAVRKPLEFGVALADVLLEACDAIIGCFELLPERPSVRVSVLTRFGQLGLELKKKTRMSERCAEQRGN